MMITCAECKKEYSGQAKACVHCGARNPNKMSAGGKFGMFVLVFVLVLVGLFIALLVIGNLSSPTSNSSYTNAQLCSQSAEAAHYIAAMSTSSDDVVRVTDEVIADRKYPLLGDKVVASIGSVVALSRGTQTPDEISAYVRNRCEQSVQ